MTNHSTRQRTGISAPGAPGQPAVGPPRAEDERVRLRALVLGIVLALAICLITPFNNAYRQGTPLGGGYFPLAPFYALVWMMIVTAAARAIFKRHRLITGREMLVTWAFMVLLSGIAWTGLARTFFFNLTVPFYGATVENRGG